MAGGRGVARRGVCVWLAQVTATLDATHVDVNHDGAEEDDFDVEQYIKDSMAASFATDDFTAQFWA